MTFEEFRNSKLKDPEIKKEYDKLEQEFINIQSQISNKVKSTVEIYTDGACSGNPGIGGWGTILRYNGEEQEFSGRNEYTTNNQMEMQAVIEGLKNLPKENAILYDILIYSDSAYVCNAFNNGWINSWIKNNWIKSDKKPVLNQELWKEMISLLGSHSYSFNKVKGHSGHLENERCDKLATSAARGSRLDKADIYIVQ